MIKGQNGIGVDNVKKYIANLKDIQLALYFDTFLELRENDDVFKAIYASAIGYDFELFYKLLLQECSKRFSLKSHDEVDKRDRKDLKECLEAHLEEALD